MKILAVSDAHGDRDILAAILKQMPAKKLISMHRI